MGIQGDLAVWEPEDFGTPLVDVTIGDLFDHRVAESPDKEALVYDYAEIDLAIRWNYREYHDRVDELARGLIALGIEKGDHVAVLAPNLPEWILLEIALAKIGAVLVTVNTNYRKAEIEYVLRQGDIAALFMAAEFRGNSYLESLYGIAPELKELMQPTRQRLECAGLPRLRHVVLIGAEAKAGLLLFPEVVSMGSEVSEETLHTRQATVRPHDVAQMQYTSGTTGFPKAVMLTHHSLVNQAHVATTRGHLSANERYVTAMPLFHVAGCLGAVIYSIHLGCTLIPLVVFDALKHLELFEKEKGTFTFAVPTMLIAMLTHPRFSEFDLSSVRLILTGATPVPVALMEQVKEKVGADCTIVFGMTETTGAVTQSFHTDTFDLKSTTVGLPQPHTSIRIVDPSTGQTVRVGESGELLAKAFSTMKGYYNMPEQTAAAIDDDGWLHSGDLAVMRQDGYINIVGRVKDMIIRGGENIYPAEIEAFLMRHPAVADVQVVGIPDAFMGEEVGAFIRLRQNETADEDAIRLFCRENLSRHKVPKFIRFVQSFPLTASGKVKKFELREQLLNELGLNNVQSRTA